MTDEQPPELEQKKGSRRFFGWRFWIVVIIVAALVGGWLVYKANKAAVPLSSGEPSPEAVAVAPPQVTEGKETVVPVAPIEDERIVGLAFTDALIDLMQGQLDRFLGWRPNDLIIGRITDNVRNYQLGVLEVVRRTMLAFNDKLARFGSTYPLNAHLNKAFNDFNFRPDKFWFPSSAAMYREALGELGIYRKNLIHPEGVKESEQKSLFFPRSDNLIFLIDLWRELLGSCQNDLTKQTEDDGSNVSVFKIDDYFFYSYGVMAACLDMMRAVKIDFREEINSKSAMPLVDDIIKSLAKPVELLDKHRPLKILDAPITSIFNNHRAQLNRSLADARQKLNSLQQTLQK